MKEIKEIANNWFNAFNDHDLPALLSLYDNDAAHYSPKLRIRKPETKGLIQGKAALQTWWEDAFERLPSLQYELIRLTAEDKRVFMEYIRHVSGEESMRVAEVLETEHGLIVASAVYHG